MYKAGYFLCLPYLWLVGNGGMGYNHNYYYYYYNNNYYYHSSIPYYAKVSYARLKGRKAPNLKGP